MIKVYLASSLKNYTINHRITRILESKGISCFLPQRDALESTLKNTSNNNHVLAGRVKEANVTGIKNANIVLIIARNLGSDTAWECGFATALGKRTILLKTQHDTIEDVYMLYNSVDKIIEIRSFSTKELVKVLAQIVEKGGDNK